MTDRVEANGFHDGKTLPLQLSFAVISKPPDDSIRLEIAL
jgi:hypothetical protein